MIVRRKDTTSANEMGGGLIQITRPEYVPYVFVLLGSIIICQLYKLTLSDQAQVTATDSQSLDLV